MKDDYLWDRRGEPDPEVQRLEKMLARFRHSRPAPEWRTTVRKFPLRPLLAVAASLGLLVGSFWLATRPKAPMWEVVRLEGSPTLGTGQIVEKSRLHVSEWIETDTASRVLIESEIGTVEVEPNSRVRLQEARTGRHRLELPHGKIRAFIWAPARQFYVETPSAVAVDLGCAYILEVDAKGAGQLRVSSGWVAFELDGRESFIPAGAVCATRPRIGPGTPYFEDASAEFQAGLARIDFEQLGEEEFATVLRGVLAQAREEDAFSLWHLLVRLKGREREAVYDRLAALAAPPGNVTREGVLAGDKEMLDRWWDTLGLGRADWFRLWRNSAQPEGQ